jgi:branched-subunit amino acid transport protein
MPETAALGAWWWPIAAILVGGLVTYAWRALGVALSGRIDPEGPLFAWVACVAYALLAGLIARMILLPRGELAGTAALDRLAAAALALAVFFLLTRRNMLAGVAAGSGTLVLLTWARAALG